MSEGKTLNTIIIGKHNICMLSVYLVYTLMYTFLRGMYAMYTLSFLYQLCIKNITSIIVHLLKERKKTNTQSVCSKYTLYTSTPIEVYTKVFTKYSSNHTFFGGGCHYS